MLAAVLYGVHDRRLAARLSLRRMRTVSGRLHPPVPDHHVSRGDFGGRRFVTEKGDSGVDGASTPRCIDDATRCPRGADGCQLPRGRSGPARTSTLAVAWEPDRSGSSKYPLQTTAHVFAAHRDFDHRIGCLRSLRFRRGNAAHGGRRLSDRRMGGTRAARPGAHRRLRAAARRPKNQGADRPSAARMRVLRIGPPSRVVEDASTRALARF